MEEIEFSRWLFEGRPRQGKTIAARWAGLAVQNLAGTPTPWLTLLLVLGKSRVKQNSC